MESREDNLKGRSAPAFSHESSHGYLELKKLLGKKPLVLLFVADLDDPSCRAYVDAFERDSRHYRAFGSEVIILAAGTSVGPRELSFVAVPEAQEVFSVYEMLTEEGLPLAGVVIVDRYGEIASIHAAQVCSDLPSEPRVARLLVGAESLCPECGVPEDHWLEVAD
ncbi:MAG: redoxin domain-containing protein [Armatimonadetes bacterium]|nr:redoxin domain-containing protein [Armatimonadota bacterium]